ncbi:MAG: tRNA 2-thiouridine synthesizing protein E [Pseudohongiellaceae bacterium]|jgi:tRNA 2-thiouridine synthesizing protein E
MSKKNSISIGDRIIDLDKEGYLHKLDDWTEKVANMLAKQEGIDLQQTHWDVIHLLRSFYRQHQVSPANRALVNLVKRELGPEKGKSAYLMGLFGGSPAKICSKIAGLPKPDNCL